MIEINIIITIDSDGGFIDDMEIFGWMRRCEGRKDF
jgi:hypothetical protein